MATKKENAAKAGETKALTRLPRKKKKAAAAAAKSASAGGVATKRGK